VCHARGRDTGFVERSIRCSTDPGKKDRNTAVLAQILQF